MSQREGFTGGFLAGVVVGSVLGGIVGALVGSQRQKEEEETFLGTEKSSELPANSEESIEFARRSLEDKIAQLNLAIDDVRQQLGSVNGHSLEVEREK